MPSYNVKMASADLKPTNGTAYNHYWIIEAANGPGQSRRV